MWPDGKLPASLAPDHRAGFRHQRRAFTSTGRFAFRRSGALLLLVFAGLVAGCRTPVSLPPVNLNEPGWTVRRGQAIWRRKRGGQGVAGELLVATRSDGQAFVQFSKNPFPLVVARTTSNAWSVEFPPQNKHYSGHGLPPHQIIFLYLPRVLSGLPPPHDWSWQPVGQGGWLLENHATGESLEVYFNS